MHPSGNQRPRESRSHELERWKSGDREREQTDARREDARRRRGRMHVVLLIRKSFLLVVPYGLSKRTTLARRHYR